MAQPGPPRLLAGKGRHSSGQSVIVAFPFRGGRQLAAASEVVGDGTSGPGRRRQEGGGGPRRADGEVLCGGKDGYCLSQNAELESELTSVAAGNGRLRNYSIA